MNLYLPFGELSEYISRHFGKTVTFERAEVNEFRVAYSQKVIFRTVQIKVNIAIDKVRDSVIGLTYNGGFGLDMMIAGALTFAEAKFPELAKAIVVSEGRGMTIDLATLPQTRALTENLRLDDILIREDGFEVKASLK